MTQIEHLESGVGHRMGSLHISGRRWFEKTNGNTYHSVAIYIDGHPVKVIGFTYGYGSQYAQSAGEWLAANGYLPNEKHGNGSVRWWPLSLYCREHEIQFTDEVVDVARKKDLHRPS